MLGIRRHESADADGVEQTRHREVLSDISQRSAVNFLRFPIGCWPSSSYIGEQILLTVSLDALLSKPLVLFARGLVSIVVLPHWDNDRLDRIGPATEAIVPGE